MIDEHLYLVAYDIANPKRWRRVFKAMNGYGEWLQLSLFQCRLTATRRRRLEGELVKLLDPSADRALIADLGPAWNVTPRVTSLGAPFTPIDREPVIG